MSEYELCPFCASNMITDIAGDPKRGTCLQCGAECDEWNRRDLDALQQKTITRLEAERKRLREALKPFAEIAPHAHSVLNDRTSLGVDIRLGDIRAARAALEGGE